jgi:hypothetical protein
MAVIPYRFLFRMAYSCRYVKEMPLEDADRLVELPSESRIDNFATMEGAQNFADLALAWNERGIGLQLVVRGKEQSPQGDAARPRSSDGLTLWLDTRDARTAHRASRYCHMFHCLPAGGGSDRDQPVIVQEKINRATEDAPLCKPSEVPFHCEWIKGGYRLEAFLPASVLNGFDPEQNPRLGVFYAVRDAERGVQLLTAGEEFPYWEDSSLWSVLELVRP